MERKSEPYEMQDRHGGPVKEGRGRGCGAGVEEGVESIEEDGEA